MGRLDLEQQMQAEDRELTEARLTTEKSAHEESRFALEESTRLVNK